MHGNASNDEHLSADLLEKLAFMCLGCHLHLYVGTNFWIIISSSPEELTIYSEHRAACLPPRAISLSLQCPEMGNNVLSFYPTTPGLRDFLGGPQKKPACLTTAYLVSFLLELIYLHEDISFALVNFNSFYKHRPTRDKVWHISG